MNDKEYVNNKCKRCLNRNNDKDLCNIVQTISGEYRCSNEDVIEIEEYIRNKEGFIGNVQKIIKQEKKMVDYYYCCESTMASSYENEIIKHNKNVIELIQVGDYINGMLIEDIEKIDNKKVFYSNGRMVAWTNRDKGIETILTKEQYRDNCFEI